MSIANKVIIKSPICNEIGKDTVPQTVNKCNDLKLDPMSHIDRYTNFTEQSTNMTCQEMEIPSVTVL